MGNSRKKLQRRENHSDRIHSKKYYVRNKLLGTKNVKRKVKLMMLLVKALNAEPISAMRNIENPPSVT